MCARYDKSLVKAVDVLLKFTDPPPVGLSLISKVGYRWEKMSSVTICRLNPIWLEYNFAKPDGKIPRLDNKRIIVLKNLNHNNRQSLIWWLANSRCSGRTHSRSHSFSHIRQRGYSLPSVALCCESSPSISARTFGSTSSFRYANLVTEESFVLSISAWNLFQNGSHASYVPLNFVICSFGSFVFLCSLWLAFSTGCCFALVYSSWCSNSSFISIFSLSNLSSSSRTRTFLSSSSFCLRCWISSFVTPHPSTTKRNIVNNVLFAGLSIITVDDLYQLPPI